MIRFAIVLALLGIAIPSAASGLVMEAPDFAVGDTWEFSGTENGKPFHWVRTIVEATPDGRLRVRVVRNGVEAFETFDKTMNMLVGGRLDRARVLAKYPLATGASWRFAVSFDNPNAMTDGEAKVVAQERITVPGGTFDCLKVETATADSTSRSFNRYQITTRWHCPEVKWYAKSIISERVSTTYNPAENMGRETSTELIRFTPGK